VKKSLKKLNLSRETIRSLEGSDLGWAGGNDTKTTTQSKETCPELCDPVISLDVTCLCA